MSVAYASVGQAIEIFYFHDYIFNPEIAKNFFSSFLMYENYDYVMKLCRCYITHTNALVL